MTRNSVTDRALQQVGKSTCCRFVEKKTTDFNGFHGYNRITGFGTKSL